MTEQNSLQGRKILAVEDEMLAALMLEDILQSAECDVISAGHVEQALLLARQRDLDAAILDVNLHGLRSFPVADALEARSIPFLFLTGYRDNDIKDRYPGAQVVHKPYNEIDLIAALTAIIFPVASVY